MSQEMPERINEDIVLARPVAALCALKFADLMDRLMVQG
jgi:hypothetical protein